MSTKDRVRVLRAQGFPVPVVAAAVGISRSRAYAVLREKPPAPRADPDALTKQRLRDLAGEFPTYGYRRLTVWLNRRFGQRVNRKRVLRLCHIPSCNKGAIGPTRMGSLAY